MANGFAPDFLNVVHDIPPLPPPFTLAFLGEMHRNIMPIPAAWIFAYGDLLTIFCRLALPNQAPWNVDMLIDRGQWCFGRGWDVFAVHAQLVAGDQMHFAYQGEGFFVVTILDMGPAAPVFNGLGIDPLPDIEQLFQDWDVAAAEADAVVPGPVVGLGADGVEMDGEVVP